LPRRCTGGRSYRKAIIPASFIRPWCLSVLPIESGWDGDLALQPALLHDVLEGTPHRFEEIRSPDCRLSQGVPYDLPEPWKGESLSGPAAVSEDCFLPSETGCAKNTKNRRSPGLSTGSYFTYPARGMIRTMASMNSSLKTSSGGSPNRKALAFVISSSSSI